MPGWEMKIITAEARRLLALAAEDAELGADLRALAEEILAATEAQQLHAVTTATPPADVAPAGPTTGAEPASPAGAGVPHSPTTQEVAQSDRPQAAEPLKELTLGRSPPAPVEIHHPPGAPTGSVVSDDEFLQIEFRCRQKAEAARRASARRRRIREGADSQAETVSEDPEIAAWADRLTDCFYWMNTPDASTPDLAPLDDVGGCFEAISEALSLITKEGRRGAIERSLPLLAEAQSALRQALRRLQAPDDPDQLAVYEWVRETAARHRVFLKRHMRADDRADPARWPDLLARIDALAGGDRHARQRRPRIERVCRHLETIREGHGTDQDWQAVIEAVDEMVGAGVPPSDRQIRDLLLAVIDDLPARDDLPHGFRLVLREIDRYLATRTRPSEGAATHEPTAEVKEARRLLGGRGIVLIGGTCRPAAQKALTTALGLKELTWIETKEHQSIETFEPAIARPDVALVLLAIRWSSHAFGEVKQFCDRYGKPLVRLPGGYGPNQVAAQILAQCSGQLGGG